MMMIRPTRAVLVALLLTGPVVTAQKLPTAAPASVGLASERLDRLHRGMQAFVDRREAAGIVTLLARDGKVVDVHAVGAQDTAANRPMKTDTIFRIASMTKPITSVGIMMLVEEGRLQLTDPLSKYIPAFKDMKVQTKNEAGADVLVPARRPITIRDLLTHRSGLTYGFIDRGPVGDAYRKGNVSDGLTSTEGTIGENIERLAAVPLVSHPGAEYHYSLGPDVLGRVIEVVAGTTFDVFLRDRIFKPLQMNDTGFAVPEDQWSRFAAAYAPDANGAMRPMTDPEAFGNTHMSPIAFYKTPKKYFSGGAGLVSTAADYARFAQMLLNGGELDGVRLLSPKTVELMTVSHTSDLPAGSAGGPGANFGLGFRVVTDLGATQTLGSEGSYGWSGIYGTTFWVDPKEKLVAIMMVQRYPGSPVAAAFQSLAYQALTSMKEAPVPAGVTSR